MVQMKNTYATVSKCVYTQAKRSHTHVKDHLVDVRVMWIMKTPNNPACTESVIAFVILKIDVSMNI